MPSIDFIVMGLIALIGVLMIITNNPLFIGTGKYTEESLKRYPRPAGLANIIFGLSGIAFLYTLRLFFNEKISGWIPLACFIVLFICIIVTIVINKKILVKR